MTHIYASSQSYAHQPHLLSDSTLSSDTFYSQTFYLAWPGLVWAPGLRPLVCVGCQIGKITGPLVRLGRYLAAGAGLMDLGLI